MSAPTSPTWYDVLGVEPGATPAEIRTAWRDGIADLDPTDRRFRSLNEAAEVLLDDRARSEYDAELAPEPAPEPEPAESPEVTTAVSAYDASKPPAARRGPSALLLIPLAVVTVVMAILAGYLLTQPSNGQLAVDTQDAQSAAERAATVILAYDYRRMDADQKAADALMTPAYRKKYDALFAQIKANADQVQPVVTAQVLGSGIVRADGDRVQVLVFVNRPTTRADGERVYHDQVRFTMEKSGSNWLVDDLETGATG